MGETWIYNAYTRSGSTHGNFHIREEGNGDCLAHAATEAIAKQIINDHNTRLSTPADTEQLVGLRRVAELTLKVLDDADYGLDVYALAPNLKSAAKALRNALGTQEGTNDGR